MDVKDELIQIFPTPLVICRYPRSYEKELEWIEKQDCQKSSQPGKESFNRQSVDTFILDNPELKKIRTFIETKLYQFVTKVMLSTDTLAITQSWVNRSGKGESHHGHMHPNSIISGVWYPIIDETLPPIQFQRRDPPQIMLQSDKFNNINSETYFLPLKAGELILFPSNLRHSVPANKYDKERVSLSFNTWPKGSMGSIDRLTYLPFDRLI